MNWPGHRGRSHPTDSATSDNTLCPSEEQIHPKMSSKTRCFLEKICYRRAAYVDMTQHGDAFNYINCLTGQKGEQKANPRFISDSKASPVNLLLRPLRDRLEKICGPDPTRKKTVGTDVKKKGALKTGGTSRSVAATLPRRANKVSFINPSKK